MIKKIQRNHQTFLVMLRCFFVMKKKHNVSVWCMCIAISPKNFVCIESEEGYYLVISKITFLDPFYSHQDRVKCVTIPHCTDCTDCCTRMPLPKISFCESLRNSKSRGLLGKFTPAEIYLGYLLGIFILQIYLRNILLGDLL